MLRAMSVRAYVGVVIGFIVGFLISEWFASGAPENEVLFTMQAVCGLVGAVGGYATGMASKAGNGRAPIAAGLTIAACLLVGLAMWIYRWLFL
jgi:hypothetical protein